MNAPGPAHAKRGWSIDALLASRMAAAAVVASLVVGVLAVAVERQTIGDVAIERAVAGVTALLALVENEKDPSAPLYAPRVQAALERLKANAAAQRDGRFVSVAVYDLENRRIARIENPGHPASAAITALPGLDAPPADPGTTSYAYSRTGGAPVVTLSVPVAQRAGPRLGSVSAVFAVSEEAIAEANERITRRVLIAVGIVLATVLLVYPIISRLVHRLQRAAHHLLDANLDSIAALGNAIAKKDSDTDIHNYRVTIYAARLGEAAGLDRHTICALMKGAFLHDVGKIGIPDAILLKPGKLDEREFAEMKKHVQHGLEIVGQSSWLKDAADVVGGHHEKFDGSGYLQGLRGEAIPVAARIFAVADVFDALTSRRPYKEPISFEETLSILEKGRGSHFDPRLLDLFRGIAKPLFEEFGNRDDDRPRVELRSLIDRYFKTDDEILLA
jgi:HD-GYP domain-containing protein (c-di-GMP phosphodiesterase class II)